MVEYYIEAIDPRGKNTTLKVEAKNSSMADEMVRAQGLHPTLIKHAKSKKREEQKEQAAKKRRKQFGLIGVIVVAAVLAAGYGVWLWIESIKAAAGDSAVNIERVASSNRAASRAFGGTEELTDFARNLYAYLEGTHPGIVRGLNVPDESTVLVELSFLAAENPAGLTREMASNLADMMHGIFQTDATVTLSYESEDVVVAQYENDAVTVNVLHEIGKPVAKGEEADAEAEGAED